MTATIRLFAACCVLSLPVCWCQGNSSTPPAPHSDAGTFANPLLPTGPDPWVIFQNGFYYYMNTVGDNLTIWKTRSLPELKNAEKRVVWRPPASGPYSHEIWAPELHFFNGKWYIYFSADAGTNQSHRLWVLENSSDDPLEGEWTLKGKLADPADKWAIDGTVFENAGKFYAAWSGWEGDVNGVQSIYLAELENPWTVKGHRVRISTPEYPWEKMGDRKLNRNPEQNPALDMARGVDTAGHRGAISAKGKTVAVFGTGVDVIYPKENSRLSEQILAFGGVLLSEFPMGTFAAPQNFPIRNRILSGMSVGVLVVEAAEYSGTRITARLALEQNRDVFAVPGNVTNKNSWGPNTLIKQGAKLVATWEDVWEELPTEVRLALTPPASPESSSASSASLFPDDGLPPHEKLLLSLLKADEATHIDELIERLESQMSSSEIFAALFELELNGKVRQMPGKNFVKSF